MTGIALLCMHTKYFSVRAKDLAFIVNAIC